MLNKRYLSVLLAIVVVVTVGTAASLIDIQAKETAVHRLSKISYHAVMPDFIYMKAGETKTIPVEIKSDSQSKLAIDIGLSAQEKELLGLRGFEDVFHESVSVSAAKSKINFNGIAKENSFETDTFDLTVSVAENAEPGTYDMSLSMLEKKQGSHNLHIKYFYIIVE